LRISVWISVLLLLSVSCWARADSFVVDSIEVNGIKKITIGTVLSYLPINVGESLDIERTPEIIRELYSTGFFENIELFRRDNVLIIEVVERPSIAEVNFEGNDDIEDESLEQALDQVGIAKGRIFNENNLEKIQLELQQVYYSLGKYSASIDAKWRSLDEDRIAIDIIISEGVSATIKTINVVGNRNYDDEDLLEAFQLETTSSGLFADDEYSSSKLSADLESLKSFYLDRGYIQFRVNSQQVTISPDRKDISLSINIFEGEQFAISSIELAGEMVVDANELRALITFREGEIFSRKEINKAITLMQKRLGEAGYAFAKVRMLNELDEENKTVALQFLIEPGKKMRVRYINFSGNEKTQNTVLRRELRQLEGEVYQSSKVDRSRVRLQRLNYLASVDIKPKRVPDADDLVDLDISVTERFSGNLSVGVGFAQNQGLLLNLGFKHENIFGTGNGVEFSFDNSSSFQRYSFSYTNPYYTQDGISRSFNFAYSKTDTDDDDNDSSNYRLDRASASIDYGIPLSEYNNLKLEFGVQQNDFSTTSGSSKEVFDFVRDTSDKYDDSTPFFEIDGETYQTVFSVIGFAKDTRNRRIFASSGSLNSIALELQVGDLDYYKLRYRHQTAFGLTNLFTLHAKGRVGYGDGLGDYDDLPIYEKYTAGGVRSVRGYEFNSLGPRDSTDDAEGGNLQTVGTAEILFPIEALASADTFRLGVYFDIGNVFAGFDDYETSELRQSVGISAKWFSVIGPIEFSYAFPLNDESGDDPQPFQFALGAQF
jgi:outer membrane protein insertion porin family